MKPNKIIIVVALASVFFMAGCFVALGASSISIMKKLGLDRSNWGTIVGVFLYSAMFVQFFIGAVTDKIGHKPTALVGFSFAGLAWFLIAIATSYPMLIVGAILTGYWRHVSQYRWKYHYSAGALWRERSFASQ